MKNAKATRKLSGVSLVRDPEPGPIPEYEEAREQEQPVMPASPKRPGVPASEPGSVTRQPFFLKRLRNWFATSTFAPAWLPERLQHPLFGYFIAVLLQAVAVLFTLYLDSILHVFAFIGPLEVLATALVALSWGVGPSLAATLVGAALVDYTIFPPRFSWEVSRAGDLYQLWLLILIGLAISIVASQTERARRRAERLADSLAKEHARLETIIQTVPDIVAIYDGHGRLTQMNELGRHSKIFDPSMKSRSLEALFAEHEAFTLSGKRVEMDDLPVVQALRGDTVEGAEVRFFDGQGAERFISISAAPMRNFRGKIEGVVSVTRDLSALHQSEREGADRAMELEAIFHSLADGLFVVDKSGMIIRSNAAFQDMLGLTEEHRETFMSLSREERYRELSVADDRGTLLPYESWPETRILSGEVLKGFDAVDVHLRNLAGRRVQWNISGAPLYTVDGKLVAALCICRDVTERRILERRTHDALDALLTMAEALVTRDEEEARQEYDGTDASRRIALRMARLTSKVLNCTRASIFLVSASGDALVPVAVEDVSPQAEQLWWEHAAGVHLSVDSQPPVASLLARLQHGEIVLLNQRDASLGVLGQNLAAAHITLVVPISVNEHLIGVLALGQEDPAYIYAQEDIALSGAVAHLLALVFERDRLLHERAEAQGTELALRAANRHMEEFLGMVSHELKTPLTSIKGNTQLAIRQIRNSMQGLERIFGLYEAAEQQSRRLNRLVDDLLDVSRTQNGHLELIPGPCDLREIVHEAIQEQQKMWAERTISLKMDEETPLPLEVDADRIAQVISNYLTNALKYSEQDRPVQVNVRRDGQQVYLAVHDQGPGLSAEALELIWERFYRVQGIEVRSNSHTSQAGLGLGLYITRNIIEGHQGQVGVESEPGAGSTFWFSLPLRQAPVNGAKDLT